ncbi:MAG: hypothetical protein Q617_SPSC00085G0001, partial [Streptococcus sp. DORA_10]
IQTHRGEQKPILPLDGFSFKFSEVFPRLSILFYTIFHKKASQNQKGKDCLTILFLIFYPSTLNFLRLPKNSEPPIIARIPPTQPRAGIKPTAPPTINRTEGAEPIRLSPL